jgi:Tfp pilus assembly pilus retraction ATPase PilT
MTALKDLPFVDLYVRLDQPGQALYHSKGKGLGMTQVPAEYQPAIDRLAPAISKVLHASNDGSLEFEGVRCRVSKEEMADHGVWACARRINANIPDIEKLNILPGIYEHMKGLGKRDGLILVCGSTGHGKTTTATALLAHYLRTYGGLAITIEDPVEYMLTGHHGESGYCFQVQVRDENDWALCLKRSMRLSPHYLYVGEIRTPKAAEQLLRAATTGHLVITTMHAGSPEEALMGLMFLAEQAMGPGVQNILAGSITALIHQTMREGNPWIKYLFTEENAPGDPVRSLIRENKIGMISTYIDRTASRLVYANPANIGQVTGNPAARKP